MPAAAVPGPAASNRMPGRDLAYWTVSTVAAATALDADVERRRQAELRPLRGCSPPGTTRRRSKR
ncbi:hypothetical protein [Streptomyces sp. NPDC058155]|uniref:hypothetical protein n=1 Tax=Streptomyces sp. NPDC058155 TaxID=3346359 RepID=UPI0036EBE534